jgi:hypothetical protein
LDLIADLRHYPAPDALQWAAAARFDGPVVFRRNQRAMTMAFSQGRIVRCESNQPLESFRHHLFAQGWVDRLDLAAAESQSDAPHLGAALVAMKVLTPHALRDAYTEHTLDLACSVVPWPDGVVAASATNLRPLHDPESEPLDPVYATMEAARREDELARIRETLPHDNVRLGTRLGASTLADWEPGEKRLLDALVDNQTAGELYQEVGGCKFSFWRNLFAIMHRQAILCLEIGRPPRPEKANRLTLVDVLLDSDLDRRLMA